MPTDFKYVPTSGALSGASFEEQTERAFNELGAEIDDIEVTADGAVSIAQAAMATAQNAENTADNAMSVAQGAQTTAETAITAATLAQDRANAAFDMAATAQSTAGTAITTANEAKSEADNAEQMAGAAVAVANDAEEMARTALGLGFGVYANREDSVDLDQKYNPAKLYLLNAVNPGLPISTPAYFDVVRNSSSDSATQRVWNESEEKNRLGVIMHVPNTGTDEVPFTAIPSGSSTPIDGTLTVTSGGPGVNLAAVFSPGGFTPSAATPLQLGGALTFTLADFEDGSILISGVEAIIFSGGDASIVVPSMSGVNIVSASYNGTAVSIVLNYIWDDTTDTVAWESWRAAGGVGDSVPSGVITMWSGAIADIPTGWALCNGQNGTPNLLDRFIIAAGNNSAPGDTGGAETHTHGITVDATALSIDQMPNHAHSFGPYGQIVAAGNERTGMPEGGSYSYSGKQGGGLGHVHSASSGSASNIPPYYALAYIMKL